MFPASCFVCVCVLAATSASEKRETFFGGKAVRVENLLLIFWGGNECASRARDEEEETQKECVCFCFCFCTRDEEEETQKREDSHSAAFASR